MGDTPDPTAAAPSAFNRFSFSFSRTSPDPLTTPPAIENASPPTGYLYTSTHGTSGAADTSATNNSAFLHNAALPNAPSAHNQSAIPYHTRPPLSAPLQTQTSAASTFATTIPDSQTTPTAVENTYDSLITLKQPPLPMSRPTLTTNLSVESMTTALSSPAISPLDIVPLPTPLEAVNSSPPRVSTAPPLSSNPSDMPRDSVVSLGALPNGMLSASPAKQKKYQALASTGLENRTVNTQMQRNEISHGRNRSISEFMPEAMYNERPRHVTISSGSQAMPENTPPPESHMHRELCLAAERALTHTSVADASTTLPTPPPSNVSVRGRESLELKDEEEPAEYITIRSDSSSPEKAYRLIRPLGQGTFSKVVLATSEKLPGDRIPADEAQLDPRQLVAIKIIEHGPAGGADEERMELSLRREVELLRSIWHPSVIHLKAFNLTDTHARLVLNYCPGGDLFEFASERRDVIAPALVQRIFAELVCAVRYLHSENIVHRDIKLENVLLNIPTTHLPLPSPQHHPHPLVTLIDLGLARRIDPAAPLLTTRCGSEDYCAPEILLGQAYDGRGTDAWALGVLLYALMEGRLPFDAPPGKRGRAPGRPAHRIARCDWMWCAFGDEYGDWREDPRTRPWEGARPVVEGLLKKVGRGRLRLDQVSGMEWVKGGILVEGGLKRMRGPLDDDEVVVDGR